MLEPRYQPTPEKYIGKSISQTLSENLFAPSNLITTNCRKYIIKLKLIPNQDLSRERAAQNIFLFLFRCSTQLCSKDIGIENIFHTMSDFM